MAEGITASSMGQAIGLGYRTKDIGPQLMQFQASELARRSQEKAIAKKEKKNEYDKMLEKVINVGNTQVHKTLQKELNAAVDKTRAEVTTFSNTGDTEGMLKSYVNLFNTVKVLEGQTKNYVGVEDATKTKSQLVPYEIINSISGDVYKPINDQAQMDYLSSIGWAVDPVNKMYTNEKGYKPRTTLNEILTTPMPTKEVLLATGSVPTFVEDPTRKGYNKSASEVFVPSDKLWYSVVDSKLQDNEFVANEIIRITDDKSQNYATLSNNARTTLAGLNPGIQPTAFSIADVNRQIVRTNLDENVKPKWKEDHTLGEGKSVEAKVTPRPNPNDDKDEVNPTAVVGSEHLESNIRDKINTNYKEFKDYTDRQLIEIARKDPSLLSPQENKIRGFFDNYVNKQKRELTHTRYPTVQVALKSDNLTPPSLKDKTLKKLDEIYYNTDKKQFYARFSTTASQEGASAQVLEREIPLTVADLQYLRSASGNEPTLKTGLDNLDGNAKAGRYETIDAYITRNSSGVGSRAGMKRISQAEYNKGFADSKKAIKARENRDLTKEQYDALLAQKNMYR